MTPQKTMSLWSPALLSTVLASATALGWGYHLISSLGGRPGVGLSRTVMLTLGLAVCFVLGYQVLFHAQKQSGDRPAFLVTSWIDDRIPFRPGWVWVYGVLYYALIGLPLAFVETAMQGVVWVGIGVAMLLLLSPVYRFFPTVCTPEWRRFVSSTRSLRFLRLIQGLDNGRSCFPSLHCALATYVAVLLPGGGVQMVIPALVAASCLLVKQHSIVDIIPAVPLGLAFGAIALSVA